MVTVLLMLVLLGLLAAEFAFQVNADAGGARAVMDRFQTRLAAEAGIQRVTLMLRTQRLDVNAWYDNEEAFHHALVWTPGGDSTLIGLAVDPDELDSPKAYRFSLVADNPFDDEFEIRYGIIDEAAKLNLNIATEEELVLLFRQVIDETLASEADEEEINFGQLARSVIYWRSGQFTPDENENRYYTELNPPYRVKHAWFETVEELLMVRGFNGRVLYGEDYDRNGLLTINEDDGDESFPLDNGDNLLNRGLYPYLTVWSRDLNTATDNRRRVYLLGDRQAIRERLEEFIDDEQVISYILQAVERDDNDSETDGGQGGGAADTDRPRRRRTDLGGADQRTDASSDSNTSPSDAGSKIARTLQIVTAGEGKASDGDKTPDRGGDVGNGEVADDGGSDAEAEGGKGSAGESASTGGGMTTPASLLRGENGTAGSSPVEFEHLPVLLDHFTFIDPSSPELVGLIDVNTATAVVLRTISGLTEEQVQTILETRAKLDSETKHTPAWLITEAGLSLETFEEIAHRICTRGNRFTIESLGYSDHGGTMTRLQVVVEMRGPVAQIMYYRDITHLGTHFPVWYEDGEDTRVDRIR